MAVPTSEEMVSDQLKDFNVEVKDTSQCSATKEDEKSILSFFSFLRSEKNEEIPPRVYDFESVSKLLNEHKLNPSPVHTIYDNNDTLTFKTSIDTALQNYGTRLMQRYRPRYGAIVAIDPVTGRVLALVSYTNEGEKDLGDHLYLSSIFPAASVFKAVTAAAAIENGGLTPLSRIVHTGRNHSLYRSQLAPQLSNFTEFTLRRAFALSVNPAFGRLALFKMDEGALNEYGNRFGYNQTVPFELSAEASEMFPTDCDFTIAQLASGYNRETSLSPLLGALMASAISENGRMPYPTIVDSVVNVSSDSTVYHRESKTWLNPVDSVTAFYLRDLMESVPASGTARRSFRVIRQSPRFNVFQYGGKTGNMRKRGIGRTDWFVGFTRHPYNTDQRLAVAVVTTHTPYWTVQSSFIASELKRIFMRNAQERQRESELERELIATGPR
ncbi:penicillin-binding transpeptidase domain-containing protein [Chitinispirillales bacterium ANBcel5]|uniref:penicillin-binding transpeptidase domain-containing protein n=1 Tax=Cellulosispirillum alkaliphilum TaxID=3039283 RepID=UPI002A56AF25|nr:penicillin-binding transpeptidase domain-containing protein [Chitinispirillales bacterium ANBcel5]